MFLSCLKVPGQRLFNTSDSLTRAQKKNTNKYEKRPFIGTATGQKQDVAVLWRPAAFDGRKSEGPAVEYEADEKSALNRGDSCATPVSPPM